MPIPRWYEKACWVFLKALEVNNTDLLCLISLQKYTTFFCFHFSISGKLLFYVPIKNKVIFCSHKRETKIFEIKVEKKERERELKGFE